MALIQRKAYGSTASSGTHSITLDDAPAPGNTIVLAVVADAPVTVPDGFTTAVSRLGFTETLIAYRTVDESDTGTYTVTLSEPTSCCIHAFERDDLTGLDQTAGNAPSGNQSSVSTGTTDTTTQAEAWALAVLGQSTTPRDVSAWSNSFTQELDSSSSNSAVNVRATTASRELTAAGEYETTATVTGGTTPFPSAVIAVFKRAAAGGTTYNVSLSESGSAAESISAVLGAVASLSENASAAESLIATPALVAALAEAASAADSLTAALAQSVSLTESVAASDVLSAVTQLVAALSEAISASDTMTVGAGQVYSVSISESATTADALSAALLALAQLAESASSAEQLSAIASLQAALTESGTAADVVSGTMGGALPVGRWVVRVPSANRTARVPGTNRTVIVRARNRTVH